MRFDQNSFLQIDGELTHCSDVQLGRFGVRARSGFGVGMASGLGSGITVVDARFYTVSSGYTHLWLLYEESGTRKLAHGRFLDGTTGLNCVYVASVVSDAVFLDVGNGLLATVGTGHLRFFSVAGGAGTVYSEWDRVGSWNQISALTGSFTVSDVLGQIEGSGSYTCSPALSGSVAWVIESPLPQVTGMWFGVSVANANSVTIVVQKMGATGWEAVTSVTDGTAVDGKMLAVSGLVSFNSVTALGVFNGVSGYYWRVLASGAISATTVVTDCRVRLAPQAVSVLAMRQGKYADKFLYYEQGIGATIDYTESMGPAAVLQLNDGGGTPGGMSSADAMYVGCDSWFNGIGFSIVAFQQNKTASVMSVYCFVNGSWVAGTVVYDGTIAVSGKSLSQNGVLTFIPPSGWSAGAYTVGADFVFWVKITVSSQMTPTLSLHYVKVYPSNALTESSVRGGLNTGSELVVYGSGGVFVDDCAVGLHAASRLFVERTVVDVSAAVCAGAWSLIWRNEGCRRLVVGDSVVSLSDPVMPAPVNSSAVVGIGAVTRTGSGDVFLVNRDGCYVSDGNALYGVNDNLVWTDPVFGSDIADGAAGDVRVCCERGRRLVHVLADLSGDVLDGRYVLTYDLTRGRWLPPMAQDVDCLTLFGSETGQGVFGGVLLWKNGSAWVASDVSLSDGYGLGVIVGQVQTRWQRLGHVGKDEVRYLVFEGSGGSVDGLLSTGDGRSFSFVVPAWGDDGQAVVPLRFIARSWRVDMNLRDGACVRALSFVGEGGVVV